MASSWRAPARAACGRPAAKLCQGFDPDRKPDRGDRGGGAKLGHQSVIAPAGHHRLDAVALRMQFEFEAGIIVEAAPERGGKPRRAGIDAAPGHEADAAFELVDRR